MYNLIEKLRHKKKKYGSLECIFIVVEKCILQYPRGTLMVLIKRITQQINIELLNKRLRGCMRFCFTIGCSMIIVKIHFL